MFKKGQFKVWIYKNRNEVSFINQSYRTREAGGLTVVSSPKGCHC